MAGRNRLTLAGEVIKKFNGKVIGIPALKGILSSKLATTESTLTAYCKLLDNAGYIKEIEPYRVLIQVPITPEEVKANTKLSEQRFLDQL